MAKSAHDAVDLTQFDKPSVTATKGTRGKGARKVDYTTFPELPEVNDTEAAAIADKLLAYIKGALPIGEYADLIRKTADNLLFSLAVGEGVFKPLAEFFGANVEGLKSAKRMINAQAKTFESMGLEFEESDLVSAFLQTIQAASKKPESPASEQPAS